MLAFKCAEDLRQLPINHPAYPKIIVIRPDLRTSGSMPCCSSAVISVRRSGQMAITSCLGSISSMTTTLSTTAGPS